MTTDNKEQASINVSGNGAEIDKSNTDSSALQPIADINRNQLIRQRLKDYIIQNKLRPGDKLPTEEELGNRLRVSRAAIREALRSMEALGIIEARQGYGRVICDFTFDAILNNLSYGFAFLNHNFLQMLEIRKALDAHFIEPAIANLTPEDIATLATIVARMEELTERQEDLSQEDYAFHALLYRRANNPLAEQLFEIYWSIRMNTYAQPELQELLPGAAAKHTAILDAIKQRNVAKARQLLLDHHESIAQWFHEQSLLETS